MQSGAISNGHSARTSRALGLVAPRAKSSNICDRVISHIDCTRIIIRARCAHVELTAVLRAACGSCHAVHALLAFLPHGICGRPYRDAADMTLSLLNVARIPHPQPARVNQSMRGKGCSKTQTEGNPSEAGTRNTALH